MMKEESKKRQPFSHIPAEVLLCALSMRKWDDAQVIAQ